MNIFILDKDPKKAARFHCDKHCSKMILESAQMLSTALREGAEMEKSFMYRSFGKNHPCNIWTRESQENFQWLAELAIYLNEEFKFRFGKNHKSSKVVKLCSKFASRLPEGELTEFALAMPEKYQFEDAVYSYRSYYLGEKTDIAKWEHGRDAPKWWTKNYEFYKV